MIDDVRRKLGGRVLVRLQRRRERGAFEGNHGQAIQVNDLLYVPIDANDITLLDPADWEELDNYIETEACLREARGEIIGRNTCDAPVAKPF